MPQAPPKDRPGTELKGIDRLLSKVYRSDSPDRCGQMLGLTWAAWWHEAKLGDFEAYRVRVMRDGEILRRPDPAHTRRRKDHWFAEDSGEIERLLWRLYWREHERDEPLQDLQLKIRQRTIEKARHERYHKRHDAAMAGKKVVTEECGGKMVSSIVERRRV